jgi:phenylalanyl-tRNA synthetase beta chain
MKASLAWLRSLLPELVATDERIADALTRGGWHVRSLERRADDIVLDLVDTTRADVLGHVGLAREVAALFRVGFVPPGVDAPVRVAQGNAEASVHVEVREPAHCPHYGLLVVEDVTVGPSPDWVCERLEALGIAPSNNVIDLTRLVMLESGHPVQAYDLDRIGSDIEVRFARRGEVLALTDEDMPLDPEDLVLSSPRGPLALPGIQASRTAEVGETTRRVAFECACFDRASTSRSMRRHGIVTESGLRHERGANREDTADVLAQAGALATRLAHGAAVPGSIHVISAPWQPTQWVLHPAALRGVSLDDAAQVLDRLGCTIVALHDPSHGGGLQVSVPAFRADLRGPEDLAREIVRVVAVWTSGSR